ncbi:MAG: class I adenylate-forming enzyme family protein [Reyranellaceae bacterium]
MHIVHLFDRGARLNPDGLMLRGAGGDFTYRDGAALTVRIARALIARGFRPETPFAVFGPNTGPAMLAMLGGLRAAGAWCNVNLRNGVEANIDVLSRGLCRVLFFDSSTADMVCQMLARVRSIELAVCLDAASEFGPSLAQFVDGHDAAPLDIDYDPRAIGFQGSTGGTTGLPKITASPADFLTMNTLGWMAAWNFDAPPVNLAVAPITHAAGMIAIAQFPLGGTVVMMDKVDLAELLANIARYKVTTLFLPPTIIYMLLAHPDAKKTDFSSLRYVISAAAPIAPQKIVEGIETFGPVMAQSFGQTEAGFPLTWMSPAETLAAARDPKLRHRLLSCGRPTLNVEAIDFMDEKGNLLPAGEKGEMVVRGPTVMRGYLNDEKASAQARQFGWHHSGDVGYRDADGYIYIVDRIRDMVVSGGFNIFPFEIEQVLMKHPAVQDCAVVGVPDEKWGEAVKAVVLLAPGSKASEEELIAFAKTELGGMKAPKSVEFWPDLPRSAVGKVLKREIRAKFWTGRERAVS